MGIFRISKETIVKKIPQIAELNINLCPSYLRAISLVLFQKVMKKNPPIRGSM
jgi:hypothetical protein